VGVSFLSDNGGEILMVLQSITPVGPLPDILPKEEEVPAAAAALRMANQ